MADETARDERAAPMTAALTVERLNAIRGRAEQALVTAQAMLPGVTPQAYRDITALLADAAYWRGQVEQAAERMRALEAENERLREIVRAVANGPRWAFIPPFYICNYCDVEVAAIFGRTDHRANCPVTKARAVLAAASQAAQTEAEA